MEMSELAVTSVFPRRASGPGWLTWALSEMLTVLVIDAAVVLNSSVGVQQIDFRRSLGVEQVSDFIVGILQDWITDFVDPSIGRNLGDRILSIRIDRKETNTL